jgi:glucose/arabinose dehydrogenase
MTAARRPAFLALCALAVALLLRPATSAAENSVVQPRRLPLPDDAALVARLHLPAGFRISVFARGLGNPRILAVSPDGRLYGTRFAHGDVVMLPDADGDGRVEAAVTVAKARGMHGIAFAGRSVYLASVREVFIAELRPDGSFGPLRRIIGNLPDTRSHNRRTLGIGPDGKLYVSVGSSCNACVETDPQLATLLRAEPDGSGLAVYARGLRNTMGFGWDEGGRLWGMDMGIDGLGDDLQPEELNRIEADHDYGWPFVYGMGGITPMASAPPGMSVADFARSVTLPVLGYQAHSAPIEMEFYQGSMFPAAYRGDAFVAMHGSWNRNPPSGYEVVRIHFHSGRPVAFAPFLTGFLVKDGTGYGHLGRPAGLATGPDGRFMSATTRTA